MQGTNLHRMADHLHLAVATRELTPAGAIAFISFMAAPKLTERDARRLFRSTDPNSMACAWKYDEATGTSIPQFGPPLRLWERLHGKDKGTPVIPEIAAAYSHEITWFTDL